MFNDSAMSNALVPSRRPKLLSVFSGAGGLDVGLETAGFEVVGTIEIDADARATLKANRPAWPQSEYGDLQSRSPSDRLAEFGLNTGELELLAGGPPCQPFSRSGAWVSGSSAKMADPRANTISAYLDLVLEALPKWILIENVPGIEETATRNGSAIESGLEFISAGILRINQVAGTKYQLQRFRIDTADYGVPQHRKRVFICANREGLLLPPPVPTHGPELPSPYLTAWDAIGKLDQPENLSSLLPTGKWANLLPSIPEGYNYLWHTRKGGGEPLFGWRTRYWSFLLKLSKTLPSWTIQAKPGPATGPFHWENRRLSITELARLQTFPSDYVFSGSFRSQVSQIGNAVPSAIGELFGRIILNEPRGAELSLIPQRAVSYPGPEPIMQVPEDYLDLISTHPDHPGTGLGPGSRLVLDLV